MLPCSRRHPVIIGRTLQWVLWQAAIGSLPPPPLATCTVYRLIFIRNFCYLMTEARACVKQFGGSCLSHNYRHTVNVIWCSYRCIRPLCVSHWLSAFGYTTSTASRLIVFNLHVDITNMPACLHFFFLCAQNNSRSSSGEACRTVSDVTR